MLERLSGSRTVIGVIGQQFFDQINALRGGVGQQLPDTRALFLREIHIDMRGVAAA